MNQPMYMIFNLAVGGDWAGTPNASFDSATMKVDYVRAYSLDQVTAGAGSSPVAPPVSTSVSSSVSATLAADKIEKGTGDPKAVKAVSDQLRRLSETESLRGSLSSDEKNSLSVGYWSERHIEQQRKIGRTARHRADYGEVTVER